MKQGENFMKDEEVEKRKLEISMLRIKYLDLLKFENEHKKMEKNYAKTRQFSRTEYLSFYFIKAHHMTKYFTMFNALYSKYNFKNLILESFVV